MTDISDLDDEYLDRAQAEKVLHDLYGMPRGFLTAQQRSSRGGPPFFKFSNRTIRYSKKQLLAWWDSRLVGTVR
jgi:hypothetical protein